MTDRVATASGAVFPVLRYRQGRDAIDWLTRVFGFASHFETADSEGQIAHAELSIGGGMIMLAGGRKPDPGNPWTSERQGVYVAVRDVEAHYAHARAQGADIVMPLKETGHGREYSVRDLEGHLWCFGTYQP